VEVGGYSQVVAILVEFARGIREEMIFLVVYFILIPSEGEDLL